MESNLLEKMIMAVLTAIIGLALITQGLIPTAVDFIGGLTGAEGDWNDLLYLVITVVVLGLVAIPLLIIVEKGGRR